MKNLEKYLSLLNDEVDGLLLTSRCSRFYAAEFDIAEGIVLVSKKESFYFTDSRYIEAAQGGIRDMTVSQVGSYTAQLRQAIQALGLSRLGYEEQDLTMGQYLTFEKNLPVRLIPIQEKLDSFRWIKEPWELDRMRTAQQITDAAFSDVLPRIRAGMTEKELRAELVYCLLKNGGEGLSFDPITISGPNTSMPHGVPGDRVLQNGDFITMDFGVLYQGYCSDMTRTVALGYATEEMRQIYELVLQAQTQTIAMTRPGLSGREIHEHACQIFARAGMDAYFTHSYGHSLGLQIHEAPNCSPREETILLPGMVSSAEPGLYLPGQFGVRIEDVVILREGGCEDITHSPKNLIVL